MVSKKHMSYISNVRRYGGADPDTDHYLITTHFKVRLSSKQFEIQCLKIKRPRKNKKNIKK